MKTFVTGLVMVVATGVLLTAHAHAQEQRPRAKFIRLGKATANAPVTAPSKAIDLGSVRVVEHSGFDPIVLATPSGRIFSLTNAYRAENGLPKLKHSSKLSQVAQAYAELMAAREQMGHNIDGKDPGTRVSDAGGQFALVWENVGWRQGYPDPIAVQMQGWKDSAGHRANMLQPLATELGVGVATNAKGQTYSCQVFGKPR